jgi:hypothetical protein
MLSPLVGIPLSGQIYSVTNVNEFGDRKTKSATIFIRLNGGRKNPVRSKILIDAGRKMRPI